MNNPKRFKKDLERLAMIMDGKQRGFGILAVTEGTEREVSVDMGFSHGNLQDVFSVFAVVTIAIMTATLELAQTKNSAHIAKPLIVKEAVRTFSKCLEDFLTGTQYAKEGRAILREMDEPSDLDL